MNTSNSYHSPEYSPPAMASFMQKFFVSFRFHHSTNFVDMMSPDFNEQKSYEYGIIFIVAIIVVVFVIWTTILLIIKCKGEEVGCASGRPFHTFRKTESDIDGAGKSKGTESTGSEDFDDSSSIYTISDASTISNSIERNRKREKRTRVAFLLAWITTITFASLALVFCFSPLILATSDLLDTFLSVEDLLGQVHSATHAIESAAQNASSGFYSVSFDFARFCPDADSGLVLGADLLGMSTLIESEFKGVESIMSGSVSTIQKFALSTAVALADIQFAIDKTNDILWAVPCILLGTAILTTIAMLAVFLAWQKRSGKTFQKVMTYVILPLLVAACLTCWATAICAAVATMLSGDACIGQITPDETIQMIMQRNDVNSNGTIFEFLSSYTNGCKGPDPIQYLVDLETQLQTAIDTIWRHISTVDSIGRSKLESACGNSLEGQLQVARNLAKGLTAIRKALDSTVGSLQCDAVNPLYVRAIHDEMCTEAANGAAWGFFVFFTISIMTMMMISFRSTWYHELEEEKVYDESDVAENMIVNEHEEYLDYIAKYMHEWQEYRGFNNGSLRDMVHEDHNDEGSEYSTTGTGDYVPGLHIDRKWCDDECSYVEDAKSIDTGDISFPSLVMPRSKSFDDGEMNSPLPFPPPILPEAEECAEREEDFWELTPVSAQPPTQYLAQSAIFGASDREQHVLLDSDGEDFQIENETILIDSDFYEPITASPEPSAIFVSSRITSGLLVVRGLDDFQPEAEVRPAISKRTSKAMIQVYDDLMTNYSLESRYDQEELASSNSNEGEAALSDDVEFPPIKTATLYTLSPASRITKKQSTEHFPTSLGECLDSAARLKSYRMTNLIKKWGTMKFS